MIRVIIFMMSIIINFSTSTLKFKIAINFSILYYFNLNNLLVIKYFAIINIINYFGL